MKKLSQVIGTSSDIKAKKNAVFSQIYHQIQKDNAFVGYIKTYKPYKEEDDQIPQEVKSVQQTVPQAIDLAKKVLVEMYNAVATQDVGNCVAVADVKVGGSTILFKVPATHLIFLEKQIQDVITFISALPVLDPAEQWTYNTASGQFQTSPEVTYRTKKIPKSMVTAEPTDKHPAQVHIWNDEINIGTYSKVKFSGCMEVQEKEQMLERARILKIAVQEALQEANSVAVVEQTFGKTVIDFIFNNKSE